MFSIHDLKKDARGTIKRNYFMIIITCMLSMITLGSFLNPVDLIQDSVAPYFSSQAQELDNIDPELRSRLAAPDASDILTDFLANIGAGNTTERHWTHGVLSTFASAAEGSGNLLIGIINVINKVVFGDKISEGILVALGILGSLAVYIFIFNVLRVGLYRFLLETRRYSKTQINRVLFPWTIKRGTRTAWVMLVRSFYSFLWMLTIVGGVIKHYSYMLVPIIMAENPSMSAKDAITLSRRMMDGYKWRAFLLDLSFIGWSILSLMSLTILDVFWLTPYRLTAKTELYMFLRGAAKEKRIPGAERLCDTLLDAKITDGMYPAPDYLIKPAETRAWLRSDYKRDYSLTSLILMFFTFAFVGWLWEVILFLITDGQFINRGTTHGPWLPIYGFGGLAILVLLKKLRDKPGLMFLVTIVICGITEYFTAWALETFLGMKYWDYTGYFLNIEGRVCLEGLLVFGIAGLAATYLIAPALDDLYKKIPQKYKTAICVTLIAVFAADLVYSYFVPNVGEGITEYKH